MRVETVVSEVGVDNVAGTIALRVSGRNQSPWERYIFKKTASPSYKLDIVKWGNWLCLRKIPLIFREQSSICKFY